jgi:hypothetical protein
MKRLLKSRAVDQALRGASLVVTDRRWAAPLSAAALGFGIFAGVAIGPGAAGTLATGAQQIVEVPGSGEDDGQSGGGGGGIASTESAAPALGGESDGFETTLPSTAPLVEPVEPLPPPASEPAPKRAPAAGGKEEKRGEGAETQELKGTVVHASSAAGSYAIAIKGGELVSVHAPKPPEPGTKLSVPLRRLANGTFAEAGDLEQEKKQATEATFRGVVTFANPDPAAPAYTVSGRGSSLPVIVEPDPGGAAPELPKLGSYVTVRAKIEKAEEPKDPWTLVQAKVETEPGPLSTYLDLAGVVKEVMLDGHLLISADWTGEEGSTLTLAIKEGIDTSKLKLGDSYLATAELAEDGSMTLKGIACDEHTKGADDPVSAQGDLKHQS